MSNKKYNKVFNLDIIIFLFLLTSACTKALAVDFNLKPEVLEAKSRLEKIINDKYNDRISTQLPKEVFSVGIQIFVVNEKIENESTSNLILPEDVSLGIIDKAKDPVLEETLKQLKIKKIVVLVGLHSKLGDSYKSKFSAWLKANVRSEFGLVGTAETSTLPEVPKEQIEEKPAPPRQLNWEERFGNFQNLIGLSVLAFLLVVGIFLLKVIPSKDAKVRAAMDLRIAEMKDSKGQFFENSENQKKLIDSDSTELAYQLNANLLFDHYREHQKKIAFISLAADSLIDPLLDIWLAEGELGKKKIASFVDAILAHCAVSRINNSLNGNLVDSSSADELEWQLPEKVRSNKDMPAVFREYALLSMSDKARYLEQCYWDLLSMKSLDEKSLRPRFTALSQLSPAKIQKILNSQDKKVKMLTVLSLPEEKLGEVMAEMSFDDKKQVFQEAFESPKVKEHELEVLDESLKFMIKQEEFVEQGIVEVKSMIPSMLMSLKITEEVRLLREVCPNLADKGFYLKQNYPSIVFIGDWPKDKLKIILSRTSSSEILALLHVIPEIQKTILDLLPSRTKAIVQDSLNKKVYTDDELSLQLEGIKLKLFKMVNDSEIVLTQVFRSAAAESVTKAA